MTEGTDAPAPERELRKGDEERVLAGVCVGLGRYTGIDPIVWRAAFVLTAFAGATGVLLYIAAWMLMRDVHGGPATFEQMLNRRIPSQAVLKLLAAGLAVATALSLVGGFGWSTLVLATPLILGLVAARNRGVDLRAAFVELRDDLRTREPPPTTPPPGPSPAYYNPAQPWASAPQGPVDLAVVAERTARAGSEADCEDEPGDGHGRVSGSEDGGKGEYRRGASLAAFALWTILALAVAVPFAVFGWSSSLWSRETAELLLGPESGVFFLAAALGIVGLYALVGTWAGDPRGLMALGLAVGLVAAAASMTDLTRVRIGGSTWRPTTVAEAEEGDFRLTAGHGTLDLTGLEDLESGETVDVSVRMNGVTTLVLPEDARVELRSRTAFGAVDLEGGSDEDVVGVSVDYREVFEPVDADGTEDAEDGDDADPPLIDVRTDSLVGVVEVRHGEA